MATEFWKNFLFYRLVTRILQFADWGVLGSFHNGFAGHVGWREYQQWGVPHADMWAAQVNGHLVRCESVSNMIVYPK